MIRLRFRSRMPVPAESLFAWHARDGAFQRLAPPWQNVNVVRRDGSITDGDELEMEIRVGPLSTRWIARHDDFVEGTQFRDTQLMGPFRSWTHLHRVGAHGEDQSILDDQVSFSLPFPAFSERVAGRIARHEIHRMFRFRHLRTWIDVWRHYRYRQSPRLAVTIIGDHPVSAQISAFLTGGGHTITRDHGADAVVDVRQLQSNGEERPNSDRVILVHLGNQASGALCRTVELQLPAHVIGQSFRRTRTIDVTQAGRGVANHPADDWIAEDDLLGLVNHLLSGQLDASRVRASVAGVSKLDDFTTIWTHPADAQRALRGRY